MVQHVLYQRLIAIYNLAILKIVTVFVTMLVTANSFFSQSRMSHENGITCQGKLKIVDNPTFPKHAFFRPGAQFPCRIRHGAASFKDDAKLVVRSAALKFADDHFDSPLDLMMNTGDAPLFWNARTFLGFMGASVAGKGKSYVPFLRRHPAALVGGGGAVRRNPESFGGMVYNTKTTSGFHDIEGKFWFCRYRLEPVGFQAPEDGAPDEFDRNHPWLQNPYRHETRSRNYLKEATRRHLNEEGKTLEYRLKLQLRKGIVGEVPQWISCAVPWDETAFPFHDVAHVELTRAMDYEEAIQTWFDLGNHPESLPILPAASIDDPNSLNQLRLASIWARRARLFSYRIWGVPKKFPDSRNVPDWEAIPPVLDPPGAPESPAT